MQCGQRSATGTESGAPAAASFTEIKQTKHSAAAGSKEQQGGGDWAGPFIDAEQLFVRKREGERHHSVEQCSAHSSGGRVGLFRPAAAGLLQPRLGLLSEERGVLVGVLLRVTLIIERTPRLHAAVGAVGCHYRREAEGERDSQGEPLSSSGGSEALSTLHRGWCIFGVAPVPEPPSTKIESAQHNG